VLGWLWARENVHLKLTDMGRSFNVPGTRQGQPMGSIGETPQLPNPLIGVSR